MKNELESVIQQPLPYTRWYPSTKSIAWRNSYDSFHLSRCHSWRSSPFRQSSSWNNKWNIYKLIIAATRFSETSETFYHSTPHRVPGDFYLKLVIIFPLVRNSVTKSGCQFPTSLCLWPPVCRVLSCRHYDVDFSTSIQHLLSWKMKQRSIYFRNILF